MSTSLDIVRASQNLVFFKVSTYASRNLISARSLYLFDDAIDQTVTLPPNRISFSLGSGNRRFESRRTGEPFC